MGMSIFSGAKLVGLKDVTGKHDVELLIGDECANPAVSGAPLRISDPQGETRDYVAGSMCAGTDSQKAGAAGKSAAFSCTKEILSALALSDDGEARKMYSGNKALPVQGMWQQPADFSERSALVPVSTTAEGGSKVEQSGGDESEAANSKPEGAVPPSESEKEPSRANQLAL